MTPFPTPNESQQRLQRSGWSVAETSTASTWLVFGTY
jgi:hypothetical protein